MQPNENGTEKRFRTQNRKAGLTKHRNTRAVAPPSRHGRSQAPPRPPRCQEHLATAGREKSASAPNPTTWEQRKLGEVASIVTGSTPPTADESNYGGGLPFVSPGDIDGNRFVDSTLTTLSEKGFSLGRFIPAKSSLFVCIGSTVGKVAQANGGVTTNQQINSLIPYQDVDPDFLYSLLEHAAPMVRAQAATQAVPIVNKSTFESLEVPLPRLEEQRYLSTLLLSLDNLITLHQRKQGSAVVLSSCLGTA